MSGSRRRTVAGAWFAAALLACAVGAVPAAAAESAVSVGSEATRSAPPTITVAAVGDVMFSGSVARLIVARGTHAPFTPTVRILRGADVTVGNLETALSNRGAPVVGKTFTFRAPPSRVRGLTYAGFDLMALGNNHTRDYGGLALCDTVRTLRDAGIGTSGAGKDRAAAWAPAIIERNGARIAFLSFSQIGPSNFAATSTRSGTTYTLDRTAVNAAIRRAAAKADYVIVSFHWGVERDYRANARQVSWGRAAIRSGADLVLSHHPHVIQGVEYYRDGLIAYSLGNFVFSPGSVQGRDSMILRLSLGPHGVQRVTTVPVRINSGRPVVQTGAEARRIIGIIRRTSAERGTTVTRSGDIARLRQ